MFAARAQKIVPILNVLVALLVLATTVVRAADGGTDAGTAISNRAEATYRDDAGGSYDTASATVSVTVMHVATIVVTPDETEASDTVAPHDQITRLFRVCNTGNNSDTITPTKFDLTAPATLAALYFDNDGSGTLSDGDAPITLNQTASSTLAQRGCVGVLAVINTNDIAPQSTLTMTLTAHSNATNAVNGRGEDTGMIINVVGLGARLTDPADTNLAPSKTINGATQTVIGTGNAFAYVISFRNSGDTAARNVVMEDKLSAALEHVPATLQLNDQSVSDAVDGDAGSFENGVIRFRFAKINPGEAFRVSFRCRLVGAVPAGTGLINVASFIADNVPPIVSRPATAVANPFGQVFAARVGSSAPIAGARVELLTDQDSGAPLVLPSQTGYAPNDKNDNPFVTDAQGHFSFAVSPNAISANGTNYFLKITAPGYITRMLQLGLRPANNELFEVTVHAVDSQALAAAGSFELVRNDVRIEDLAALVMNIPMFEPAGLQITKSADRARAEIGDTVTYRIELHNPTAASLHDVVVSDRLPPSFHFAEGSALVSLSGGSDEPTVPEIANGELRFHIAEIQHGATAKLLYRVRIGANAQQGDQTNVATATGIFPTGEQTISSEARAVVNVSAGVFSTRQVLIGRVFVDTNGNNQFDDGDRPMPGVRLYLSNGQSVITDSEGLYNFPSLGDGPQVISLDPVTVPPGYGLTDGGRVSGKAWTRLLRTPIGGGGMLRQNFVLAVTKRSGISSLLSESERKDSTVAPTNESQPPASADETKTTGKDDSKPQAVKPAVQPGTYEVTASDSIEAVAPGDVRIISPAANSVSMAPGLQVEARVALNWNVRLEVNGDEVSEKNIGVRSLDHKNQVSTFTFIGINVRPGPNKIHCIAISPQGVVGKAQEIVVMGRGPAKRLQIVAEKTEIQSGGSDFTTVTVKTFDQWSNPALDGQLGIETSLGQLMRPNDKPLAAAPPPAQSTGLTSAEMPSQPNPQLVVQTENGKAVLKLIGSGAPGEARLHAQTGEFEAEERIRITSEIRRPILVGFAEMSFGPGIPEVGLRDEQGNYRSRVSFFYSGRFLGDNMLTLSYDTQRPINRTTGRDRLFQLDPLDRVYPLFGDSSTRFEAAQSNSKLYARVDRKRSFVMFGDFDTEMSAPLAGYSRKLTGVKAHFENSRGDSITLTGARPDTAFARDVFPAGSLGIMQLSNAEILPGSEVVMLEVRDRRNPEVVISRETLVRSIDYNLDAENGSLFFLRYISTFDRGLNLTQIVVTYEHRATNMSSAVYTARARKNFKGLGLKLGLSAVLQREANEPNFFLGGIDAEKTLPNRGSLQLAYATSQGTILGSGNVIASNSEQHDGNAYQITLAQPLPFLGLTLRGRYISASEGFFNPFGGTVTPGARRGEVTLEMKPRKSSTLRFGFTSERNKTENVNNGRLSLSAAWDEVLREKIRLHFGFDHRALTDDLNDKQTDSNLVTVGAEVQATNKLQFSVKREQNLGDADPTYPTQTTLGATYQLSALTKLFFTQRLAAAPIVPIGDFSVSGFAGSSSRRETAVGIETRFGKYTSMTGRYQVENGINGTDSFAVMGLQNRLPLTKELSLEFGFERGFHLLGANQSFNSSTVGFGWQPSSNFRASARYEYRDRGGVGQLFAVAAAGKLSEGVTALSRFQFSRGQLDGRSSKSMEGTAALAIRPLKSDTAGVLLSYTHRSMEQDAAGVEPTRDRLDSLATDAYRQMTKRLELFGHFALRLSASGQPQLPFVSTFSFLTQARAQYLLTDRLDWAFETRNLFQPSSHTMRSTYATEAGFWIIPDLRLGGGYNFTSASEPAGTASGLPMRRGFYFTVSSKLSNLFDLFGTSKAGLESNQPQDKEQK